MQLLLRTAVLAVEGIGVKVVGRYVGKQVGNSTVVVVLELFQNCSPSVTQIS